MDTRIRRAGGPESPGESFMYGAKSAPDPFQRYSDGNFWPRHLTPRAYITRRILRPLGIGEVDFFAKTVRGKSAARLRLQADGRANGWPLGIPRPK